MKSAAARGRVPAGPGHQHHIADQGIASSLAETGFPVTADDILTAPVIAAAYLQDHYPDARCLLLNSGDIGEDLAGLTLARQGVLRPKAAPGGNGR